MWVASRPLQTYRNRNRFDGGTKLLTATTHKWDNQNLQNSFCGRRINSSDGSKTNNGSSEFGSANDQMKRILSSTSYLARSPAFTSQAPFSPARVDREQLSTTAIENNHNTQSNMSSFYYSNDETTAAPYTHPYMPNRIHAPKISPHWPSQCRATLQHIHNLYATITSVIESQWALEAGPAHQVRPGTSEADSAAQRILGLVEEIRKHPATIGLRRLTDMPQGMVDQIVEVSGVAKRYLLLRGMK